ncbi:MAG: type II secretion system protein [Sedimentisphaerales bacterium]|nr:type II secretion system protein [Sedimentisphaerales bacterium]
MVKSKKNKGVTLIELLIVVLILAAFAGIAVPRISQSAANAKARACQTNVNLINSAIEQYYLDTTSYPYVLLQVTRSTVYFPDGEPICPVTGTVYPMTLTSSKRVDTTLHNH